MDKVSKVHFAAISWWVLIGKLLRQQQWFDFIALQKMSFHDWSHRLLPEAQCTLRFSLLKITPVLVNNMIEISMVLLNHILVTSHRGCIFCPRRQCLKSIFLHRFTLIFWRILRDEHICRLLFLDRLKILLLALFGYLELDGGDMAHSLTWECWVGVTVITGNFKCAITIEIFQVVKRVGWLHHDSLRW